MILQDLNRENRLRHVYNAPGHTPALAGGARELRFLHQRKGAICDREGIIQVMRLILTHEQADFDALASLFGASLLDERSIPVLPRRLNRNVRSFITLYGSDFSFIDPRDLPQGKVESVTLVDTQSLVTLKGMGKKTTVRVIDHHPLRSGLPADWQLTIDEVGATTKSASGSSRSRSLWASVEISSSISLASPQAITTRCPLMW